METYGENNSVELQKVRHAIYQKANRLVKSGELMIQSKSGNTVIYTLASNKAVKLRKPDKALKPASTKFPKETEALSQRKTELEYALELCIAEAKGYEDMKSLIPSQLELLIKKKDEAKKRSIYLNGQLTSTRNVLRAMSA